MKNNSLNINAISGKMTLLGFSQTDLAKKLKVSKEAVSQWVKGNKYPRPAKLLALAKVLRLTFDEIVVKDKIDEPIVAYRTNKNKKLTDENLTIAKDMGEMLKLLVPYFNRTAIFSPLTIPNPENSNAFIQKVAKEIKQRIGVTGYELSFNEIMRLYDDFRIVFIPVMWGPNGDNGLHIYLPESSITFVYANLEKVITDFKFWLLHELAHVMTPDLYGKDAERFADSFAAATLFSESLANEYYHEIIRIKEVGVAINRIKAIASNLVISPYTIHQEMNKYAERNSLPGLSFTIGGANTNFNKQVGLVSEIIFEEETPDTEKYINICKARFNTPFFDVLAECIKSEQKEVGLVQRLMNISLADAKEVFKVLVNT